MVILGVNRGYLLLPGPTYPYTVKVTKARGCPLLDISSYRPAHNLVLPLGNFWRQGILGLSSLTGHTHNHLMGFFPVQLFWYFEQQVWFQGLARILLDVGYRHRLFSVYLPGSVCLADPLFPTKCDS